MTTAVFVNTEQSALSIRQVAYVLSMPSPLCIRVTFIDEFTYPHPEAPEYATVKILQESGSVDVKSGDEGFSELFLEYQAQKSSKKIIDKIYSKL